MGATRKKAATSTPQTTAPRVSDAMLTSGVALSMGIWLMRPVMSPMMPAWKTFGRTRMMARAYMAIMKLGFMPAKVRKLDTVSFSTAPAASSTATRMRSRTERPLFCSCTEVFLSSAISIIPFFAHRAQVCGGFPPG